MPTCETNTAAVVGRLESEGWTNVGGGGHDKFRKGTSTIMVPRHKTLTPSVARSIARVAGWI